MDRERDRERERERVVPKREEPDWDMVPERAEPEPSVTSVAIQKEQVVRMVRQAQAQSSFSFGGAR